VKVAVLGNGQLGAMLQQAGQRIGIDVRLLEVDGALLSNALPDMLTGQLPYPLPEANVRITAEREHWPVNAWTDALQRHPGWLNGAAFALLSNRIRQKTLLDQLGLPTAPWCVPHAGMTQAALHQQLGPDVFLKRATGGYDGRGQQRLRAGDNSDLDSDFSAWADAAVAEQAIAFDTEVSIIGARGHDGQIVCYRLTENRHDDGVLTISLSLEGRFEHLQSRAEHLLHRVMQHLDYVGVMAIECFLVGDELLINEIAPRVHNSGHWTQAGASISQFELHLRAVCHLPLPQPQQDGCSMMINLLGLDYDPKWIRDGAAQLHWYGKQWQPGRKMGHLNFWHLDAAPLADWLTALTLPEAYQPAREWALARLAPPSASSDQ
jgi:5-(carboxyamino)imidazole ribonucleotide synthase